MPRTPHQTSAPRVTSQQIKQDGLTNDILTLRAIPVSPETHVRAYVVPKHISPHHSVNTSVLTRLWVPRATLRAYRHLQSAQGAYTSKDGATYMSAHPKPDP